VSWRQVLSLLHLPHRGSATPLEREAFLRLEAFLKEKGLKPRLLPFRGVATYGWELLAISLLLALSPLSPLFPLLGALAFFLYFQGVRPWGFLLDRFPSQNLLAWKGGGEKALVLMAHVDTAKTHFLIPPREGPGLPAGLFAER